MSTKTLITFDPSVRPVYSHLDHIVDRLLRNGNRLTRDHKWGENRTGFYCFLQDPLDFDLIENSFELPEFIRLNRQEDSIECDRTWASIRGGMHKKEGRAGHRLNDQEERAETQSGFGF